MTQQIVEAIFTSKSCYLASSRWQEAIRRTTLLDCEDFADRAAVSTELWTIAARIPNLFQAVSDHVHGYVIPDEASPQPSLQELLDDFNIWRDTWEDVLVNTCRNILRDSALRHQSFMTLLAYYMLAMIAHRLSIAIEPTGKLDLEDRVSLLYTGVFQLRKDFMSCRWSPQNNGSIYIRVANGTQKTASRWRREISCATDHVYVSADTFDEWCDNIGRALEGTPARLSIPQRDHYGSS